MTKARTPGGSGAEYLADATQIPTALTWTGSPTRPNLMDNVDEFEVDLTGASSGEHSRFQARGNGRIVGALIRNGATAADGTNGWRVTINNESRSDAEVMDLGIGTAANAAAADDGGAVGANTTATKANSKTATTSYFTTGDILTVDLLEDGTAGAVSIVFSVVYGAKGYAA